MKWKVWAAAAAALTGGAVVWLLAAELPWPARAATVLFLILLPVSLLGQARMARELPDELPRGAIYTSSAIAIWVLAFLALLAAFASGFTPGILGLRTPSPGGLLMWSLFGTAIGLGLLALGRALRLQESPLLRHLLPRTRGERLGFVGLSFTAGIGEELAYRSFLIPALAVVTGSAWIAASLSALAFGALHSYQGATGALRAAILGFLLAIPFLLSGSVLPAMIAHTALDLIAGLWLAEWLLREQSTTPDSSRSEAP